MSATISQKAGIELLKKRIGEISDLERDAGSRGEDPQKGDEFHLSCQLLNSDIAQAIIRIFGAASAEARFYFEGFPNFELRYLSYIQSGREWDPRASDEYSDVYRDVPRRPLLDYLRSDFVTAKIKLNHAVKRLEERLEDSSPVPQNPPAPDQAKPATPTRRVFIVHGHDEAAREAVARFMERIDFDVVILHERANQGQTVIEKFEANADVGFAIVLLTPDDVGGKEAGALRPRARQNVVLELGYFIGRLGRRRVMALRKGDLEFPSDILGIVAEPIDEHGAWKQRLAKELANAGYDIDWNKAMR